MSAPTLTADGCRARQSALATALQQLDVELAVLTRSESVEWLTGVYLGPLFCPTAAIRPDGQVTLALPQRKVDTPAVADTIVAYEAKWHSTTRNDQRQASVAALVESLGAAPGRAAAEFSTFAYYLTATWAAEWLDLEPTLFDLRRRKYADELAMMAHANEANRVMYECAREIIEPGVNEVDVFNSLQATAVDVLGEALTYIGQDFRSGARGGPPRDRQAEAGELYILDLGVGYRGYFTDNARTVAVDGNPTDVQQAAHARLCEVFSLVESTVRPGASCRQLFEQVQAFLDEANLGTFNHHLGHGVGLAPQEGPHLNPRWDDTFAVGDYFTAEPGLYSADLNAGIRLEQNYVVTESGVELLTDWPINL